MARSDNVTDQELLRLVQEADLPADVAIRLGNLLRRAGTPGPTGPAGATGPTGATGATGPAGPAPSGTGFVHVTSGVLDTPHELTGDVSAGASGVMTIGASKVVTTMIADSSVTTAKIADDNVTLAKLANIATARILGRVTASSGDPEELTGTQATTLIDVFTSALKGLVPAPGGSGSTRFLCEDGTWKSPTGEFSYTTKLSDTFNRANSTNNLGSTDGANALDPAAWTQDRGTWGILSNVAYISATGAGTQGNAAHINVSDAKNWAEATLATRPTANSTGIGIVAGLIDANNFYYVQCNRSAAGAFSYVFGKNVAGTLSTIAIISGAVPAVNDVMRLTRVGSLLRLDVNGSTVAEAHDSSTLTGTSIGLFDFTSAGTLSGGRIDGFSGGTVV